MIDSGIPFRVYISGPITGLPREEAMANFSRAVAQLTRKFADRERAWEFVNPFEVDPACGVVLSADNNTSKEWCGHTADINVMAAGHSWSCWMRGDLIAMLGCTHIYMLDGWEQSHGARLEHYVAVSAGLSVLQLDSYERWDMENG